DNGLYISVASEGLCYAGGIHIELKFRLPPRQQVALKMGGNSQGKGVEASIHAGIHLVLADQHRRREIGWVEGIDNTHRQGRAILVDNGDGRLVEGFGHGGGGGVNRQRKGVDDKHQHHRVATQAAQFLDPQVQNISHGHVSAPASTATGYPPPATMALRPPARAGDRGDPQMTTPWKTLPARW